MVSLSPGMLTLARRSQSLVRAHSTSAGSVKVNAKCSAPYRPNEKRRLLLAISPRLLSSHCALTERTFLRFANAQMLIETRDSRAALHGASEGRERERGARTNSRFELQTETTANILGSQSAVCSNLFAQLLAKLGILPCLGKVASMMMTCACVLFLHTNLVLQLKYSEVPGGM